MQEANAYKAANNKIKSNATNKPLTKVVVRAAGGEEKTYFALNLNENSMYAQFQGIEAKVVKGKVEEINEYSDAHNKAISGKYTVFSKKIPWQNVIEIVDVNYKYKMKGK